MRRPLVCRRSVDANHPDCRSTERRFRASGCGAISGHRTSLLTGKPTTQLASRRSIANILRDPGSSIPSGDNLYVRVHIVDGRAIDIEATETDPYSEAGKAHAQGATAVNNLCGFAGVCHPMECNCSASSDRPMASVSGLSGNRSVPP